jgi:hypothetical protein
MTQYIYGREKPKEEEEMKGKNITKLLLCMYCVRKNVSNYHFSKGNSQKRKKSSSAVLILSARLT